MNEKCVVISNIKTYTQSSGKEILLEEQSMTTSKLISKTVLPPPLPFESLGNGDTIEMGVEEQQSETKTPPKSIPPPIIKAIKEFETLDAEIKKSGGFLRIARKDLKKHKYTVFQWMTTSDVPLLKLPKKNLILEIRETELKKKPTPEQQTAKLQELITQGITDPLTIFNEIQKCGVVVKEKRLYKRKILSDAKKKKIEEAAKKVSEGSSIKSTTSEVNKPKKKKRKTMRFVESSIDTPTILI